MFIVGDADDPDLWNQTLEAEDLQQQIQSAVDKAEKRETGVADQGQTISVAQCGKKRRLDPSVRV